MGFDKALVAGKLRRWDKYLKGYHLPDWDSIPDFGLYMDQVITLLKTYVDYLPPELKEDQFITAAAINNYVRTKVMPEPVKKKYYRIHLAYLIMICTLKQGLSLALVQKIIPMGISEEEVQTIYEDYARRHAVTADYFREQVRVSVGPLLDHDTTDPMATDKTYDIISSAAVISALTRTLAEKLLLLEDKELTADSKILQESEEPPVAE